MNIGIDARFYGPFGKGLGRYTQKLIEHLEEIDTENQYVVFLRKENYNEYKPKNKNFKKVLADFRWYSFKEQVFLPLLFRKYNFDLMHFPHFNVPLLYRRKFVLTIHDLILIHFPTVRSSTLSPIFYWIKFAAYRLVIWSAIKRSEKIIAVSKFTKDDILKVYNMVPESKIEVTYEASENYKMSEEKNDDEILKKYDAIEPYIIYIGNVYPHKNPENLVLAFKELEKRNEKINLVFIGGEDYFYRRLKKLVSNQELKNISFAGYVPDNDLDILLRKSKAYIRPSFYEGFELPPLEAMSKGVPVLSSRHSCALEILGDSALYFDGLSINDIAESIIKIKNDNDLRAELISKGYAQIKKYSWLKMAEETLKIYNDIERYI